jgi:hypothetical protein
VPALGCADGVGSAAEAAAIVGAALGALGVAGTDCAGDVTGACGAAAGIGCCAAIGAAVFVFPRRASITPIADATAMMPTAPSPMINAERDRVGAPANGSPPVIADALCGPERIPEMPLTDSTGGWFVD